MSRPRDAAQGRAGSRTSARTISSAAQDLDTSPFEEPSYEKVERGLPGPWERAADRAEVKARRVERCPESSQEGARCIYDEGHGGKHFAKDAFSYYSWASRAPRPDPYSDRSTTLFVLVVLPLWGALCFGVIYGLWEFAKWL